MQNVKQIMVTISIETYFWMVDRLQIEDDTRNKVNKTTNIVAISKPFQKRIENGFYINRLLSEIYPTFSKRSDKQFQCTQVEIDPDSAGFNQPTWKQIFDQLHLFGVELNAKRREIILATHNTQSIIELIDALFEIDNSPVGQLGNATKRKLDIKTTFGTKKSMVVRQGTSPLVHQDSFNSRMSDLPTVTPQKMPNSVASPRKQVTDTSPISNRKQSQNALASPTQGRQLLGKEATLAQKYESFEDGLPQSLALCKTSVQFILVSLALAFEMKPKQAASLLLNNHAVLTHLCIKGGKGSDYSQVLMWYDLILPQAQQLVTLTVTEKVDISSYETQVTVVSKSEKVNENRSKVLYKTLNILKSGFYSKNPQVVDCCALLFTRLFESIYETDRSNDGYNWLIQQTCFPEVKKQPKGILSNRSSIDTEVLISKEFDQIRYQTGLKAVMYAYNQNSKSSVSIVQLLFQLAQINTADLMTNKLRESSDSYAEFGVICLDIFMQADANEQKLLKKSGVIKFWATLAIQVSETSQGVTVNDRIVSICLASEIWRLKPKLLEKNVMNVSEIIVRTLKTAARDIKRTIVVVAIDLLFRLLNTFQTEGHKSAAIIFKTLTFLLIEFYWEVDIREIMLGYFITILQDHTLPIDTVCDPILKQLEVSEYHQASFNVFDFEFFDFISSHSQLSLQSGLLLMTALSKIALSSVIFQQIAIRIMIKLMQRYNNRIELVQTWQSNSKNILTTLVAIQSKLLMHRIQQKQEQSNFFNRIASKNKQKEPKSKISEKEVAHVKLVEKLIVNLLVSVQKQKHVEINKMLQTQLIDTHLSIQAGLKVDCKAILYLLQFYTNKVDAMIADRADKNAAAAQFIAVPFLEEIKQLESAKGVYAPGAVDIYAGRNSQSPVKSGAKQIQASTGVSVALSLNSPVKRVKEVSTVLYDYNQWEEEWEIDLYNAQLKRHQKLVQNLHKSYVYENAAKKPLAVDKVTFDEQKVVNDQIPVQSLIKLLKDFKLTNGQGPQYLKEDVQKLVKAVNINLQHNGDLQYLSFQGFQNFLLQYAHHLWGGELKAHQLINKLFNEMSQQPKFKELNLVMLKNETTNRRDVDVMLKLEQLGVDEILNHKRIEDKHKVVEHLVPDSIPMRPHKKICIELMDEIVFKAIGSHFLEPITIEKTVSKVVPQMHSRRSTNASAHQPVKGKSANEPLSHSVVLTAEQEIAKKLYQDKFEKKKLITSTDNEDHKLHFKSQAINRRAGEFGHAIQLQVINCPAQDKQTMFEAGEVLNELLNAVSQGKKALRLDYTPYKIYNLYKKKLQGPPVVEQTEPSVDLEEQAKNKEKVKSQMARIENEMKLQKEQRQLEKKIKLEESEKLERLKAARIEEYQQVASSVSKEAEKMNRERKEQKLALENKQKEVELREQAEMRKRSEQVQQKYLEQLKSQAEEFKKQTNDKAQKEMQDQEQKQLLSEKQAAKHKRKVEQAEVAKNEKRDKFYAWVASQPVQQLLNKKYKKGLYLKFEQCLKIGQKNYGCSQSAWIDWLKQAGLFSKLDAKHAIRIHSTQVKEMEAFDSYDQWFQSNLKEGVPGEKELSYGAFVSALIKLANILNMITTQQQTGRDLKDNAEYRIPDQPEVVFENLMVLLNVSGNSGKIQEVAPIVAAKQSPVRGKTPKKEERKEEPKKGFFDFLLPKPKAEQTKPVKTADVKQLNQKK